MGGKGLHDSMDRKGKDTLNIMNDALITILDEVGIKKKALRPGTARNES